MKILLVSLPLVTALLQADCVGFGFGYATMALVEHYGRELDVRQKCIARAEVLHKGYQAEECPITP